jgi:hypothetical protein
VTFNWCIDANKIKIHIMSARHQYQMKVFGYLNLMEINKFNLILATSVPYKIGNGRFTAISMDYQLLAVNHNSQQKNLLTTKE